MVNVPTKIIKPRRFDIILELRGVTWRRIQFEVSPDEAGIGEEQETIEPPPLSGFGLPDPDALVGIAKRSVGQFGCEVLHEALVGVASHRSNPSQLGGGPGRATAPSADLNPHAPVP